jgi:ParB/RepB/Spo0J family partition protein
VPGVPNAFASDEGRVIAIGELGERLAALRLCEASALAAMQRSLARHGQLTALVTFQDGDQLELIDGFKRLRAARALGWSELRATVTPLAAVEAKVRLAELQERRPLTELEQGWLVRSLHREDGLSQGAIAKELGRHKSWVCRRLLLVERLEEAVQAQVRLGLVGARAAIALAALPRGNQEAAALVVMERGLTVRQIERLVAALLAQPDDQARADYLVRERSVSTSWARPRSAARSEVDWMMGDIAALLRVAARLQARLLSTRLGGLGGPAAAIVLDGLVTLTPVVTALGRTLATVTGAERTA